QVSCNGLENGSATVNAGGGDEDYSYAWSNGQTTQSVTGLSAGTYQVVVTDGEGCTAGATVIINEPAELVANASASAQTMNGVDDGTATANPQGGTADYTYAWSNGETTQTITGLAPGTYTVVVTDLNGCTDQQTVTVNSFDCALSASISGQNITCFGDANGSATVSLVGAEDPVTYAWSNGSTDQTITGLAPGTYTVDIVDANNCPATLSVNITQPLLLDPNTSVTHETEFGANDGTATANTVGGVGPYTYEWNTGETTQTISGLAPGSYTVIVTDGNGCSSTESVNVNAFSCAISASIGTTDVSCFGQTNGTAAVTLQGGTSPFTYNWSNGGTTSNINNLAAGVYTVSVIDSDGCETTQNTTITEPDALVAAIDNVEDVVCPTDNNGSITTQTEGGVDPYTYLWNTGSTASDLTGVGAGDYSVVITDANGCSSTLEASIASTDTDVPAVAVQNTTLALGADGTVALNQSTLDLLATDNCAVASVTIEPAVLDCERVGINSVTVVVTDNSGNSTELVVDVEVVDNLAPSVTCPANIVICPSENPVAYDAPVAVDNCLSSGGNWDLTAGLPSGSDFPTGITTQTYTYTDANGNEGTCSFTVEVTPPAEIVVVSVTNDQDSQGIGAINISVAGEGPFTYEWTLNGELVSTEEDPSNLNAGEYVVLVTDANGCSFTIDAVTVGNTSATQEPAWLQGVQLRPNPAFDEVQIVFSELLNIDLEVSLIDATGRTITREYSKGLQTVTLNVSSLPEGMYLVKISSGNAVGMRKLIVGH
ncbi:MAG: T9SS type A sorting domain-containing protein, partial [Saprospiraceae bacterium]